MNKYKIRVFFETEQIITELKQLVQNDYNTTKLNFTFDKEGRVLFKMLYPDGTQYVDEIQNNELIFGKGVLNQEGTYEYEISLYSEDGRLTDYAVKSFEVRSELVDTDEIVEPDDRVPVLDTLINEVNAIKKDVEDGKYNGKDGIDGIDGQDGATPYIGDNGNWYIDEVDTGMPSQGTQGEKGETGGVSLEEVKAITGELENLGTEDKSSLVNAINESLNGGGIDELTDEKIYLQKLDGGIYKLNGVTAIYYSNSQSYTGMNGVNCILIVGEKNGSRVGYLFLTGVMAVMTSSYLYTYTNSKILTTNNITAFTPTADYHPVHKKYVDDAITKAITTSLEGNY